MYINRGIGEPYEGSEHVQRRRAHGAVQVQSTTPRTGDDHDHFVWLE